MSEYFLLGDKKFVPEISPTLPPLYMHKEDAESGLWGGNLRSCAYGGGCPAVFVLKTPGLKVNLDRNWQYYLWAINYMMTPEGVATELHYRLAFCNMTGLGRDDTPRNNYLAEDIGYPEDPKFDKDRTCSRSVMTGTPTYSLAVGIREVFASVLNRTAKREGIREVLTENNALKVLTLNGNYPPPMKAGKQRPMSLAAVNPDDYLWNPREHRWLFFAANTVLSQTGGTSKVMPFPRGKVYDWTGDGRIYTWMPHVSREEILYPLSRLTRVNTIPSPYRPS